VKSEGGRKAAIEATGRVSGKKGWFTTLPEYQFQRLEKMLCAREAKDKKN